MVCHTIRECTKMVQHEYKRLEDKLERLSLWEALRKWRSTKVNMYYEETPEISYMSTAKSYNIQ